MPRIYRDYEIQPCRLGGTHAEVFDCVTGYALAERIFSGPFHTLRATLWCRWNTRNAVMRKAWGKR